MLGLSLGWAGAGHAAVGDWRGFWRYSLVEATILGVAGYNLALSQDLSVLVPLAGLEVLFRSYAASEAVRITRKRRNKLGLSRRKR